MTRLEYRIAGLNGMDLKHAVDLYAMLGHDDFSKMMLIACSMLEVREVIRYTVSNSLANYLVTGFMRY